MDAWEQWRAMARESERAARLAEAGDCPRSAISRYYYAAYQAATALLLYRGLTAPADREAWSHELTPTLIVEQMEPLIRSASQRIELARRLRGLYISRIHADYFADELPEQNISTAGKDSRRWLWVMERLLPER